VMPQFLTDRGCGKPCRHADSSCSAFCGMGFFSGDGDKLRQFAHVVLLRSMAFHATVDIQRVEQAMIHNNILSVNLRVRKRVNLGGRKWVFLLDIILKDVVIIISCYKRVGLRQIRKCSPIFMSSNNTRLGTCQEISSAFWRFPPSGSSFGDRWNTPWSLTFLWRIYAIQTQSKGKR
jgi:hypothetical protein